MIPIVYSSLKVTCAPCKLTESKEQANHSAITLRRVIGAYGVESVIKVLAYLLAKWS